MEEKLIGKVTHYFGNIGVAVVALLDSLKPGDRVHFKGSTTDFEQAVESMQIEHQSLAVAEAGQEIGLKVNERVREGDEVFLITS